MLGALALSALLAPPVSAAPIRLDSSFGHGGIAVPSLGPSFGYGTFTVVSQQADGGLLATYEPGVNEGGEGLFRFGADGRLDAGFPPQPPPPALATPRMATAKLADGSTLTSPYADYLERLDPTGALDTSYGTQGHSAPVPFTIRQILLLANGQVVVAGARVYQPGGREQPELSEAAVARLNADGSLDPSFGGPGGFVALHGRLGISEVYPAGLVERAGGGLAIVLNAGLEAHSSVAVGLTAAGALDPAYGSGGKTQLDLGAVSVHPQAGGGLEIAGLAQKGRPHCCGNFALVRLDASGEPDPAFGDDGHASADFGGEDRPSVAHWEADGSVIVGGSTTSTQANCAPFLTCWETPALARFDASGKLDRGFGRRGLLRLSGVRAAGYRTQGAGVRTLAERGGGLFVAGRSGPDAFIAALGADGQLDPGFGEQGIATKRVPLLPSATVEGLAVDDRGRILAVGTTDAGLVQNPGADAVVRYRPGGTLDRSYGMQGHAYAGMGFGVGPSAIAVDRAGRAIVAEGFAVMRLTATGQPDQTFGRHGLVRLSSGLRLASVLAAPNGSVLLAGTAGSGSGRTVVLRLTRDGRIDRSFRGGEIEPIGCAGRPATCAATHIALDRRGRVLLAGYATHVNAAGTRVPTLVVGRLRPNGRPDPSFGRHGWAVTRLRRRSAAADVAVQGGRILVAGWSGTGRNSRALLLALGSRGRLIRSFGGGGIARATIGPLRSDAVYGETMSLLPSARRIVVVRAGEGAPILAFNGDGRRARLAARRSQIAPQRAIASYIAPSPIGAADHRGRVVFAWNQSTGSGQGGLTTRIALQRLLVR